jgi:hypothetical protein
MATNQNANHRLGGSPAKKRPPSRVSHPSPSQTGETPMVGPRPSPALPTVDSLRRGGDHR